MTVDWELAAIEQYREDMHYEPRDDAEEEDEGMQRAERITIEGDEDGWVLVVETDEGELVVNVHGLASSGELQQQLTAALSRLDEWERTGA